MNAFPLDNTLYEAIALGAWCGTRTRGVFAADGHYTVTANGDMTVTVSPGIAWLKADTFWGVNMYEVNPTVLTIGTADGRMERIDAICIQLNKNLNTPGLIVKAGSYTPQPAVIPTPVRDLNYDEIFPFAIRVRAGATSILQEDIIDLRTDERYCGIMRDGVTGIPTQALHDQWMAWFASFRGDAQEFFASYRQMAADLYLQYQANISTHEGNALAAYDAYIERMQGYETAQQADFEAWVETLKGILNEEVAGHLQMEIEALQKRVPAAELGTVQIASKTPLYPCCALYKTTWAAGIGGAGVGPAGGGEVSKIDADVVFDEHNVTVNAPGEFGAYTEIHPLNNAMFAFLNGNTSETQSLVLQVSNS